MADGAKILIVEDDPTIGRFVELELAHAGHEVTRCTDGECALDALDDVDARPHHPRHHAAGHRRRRDRQDESAGAGMNMPILMLTARSETQDVVRGFDAGPGGFPQDRS